MRDSSIPAYRIEFKTARGERADRVPPRVKEMLFVLLTLSGAPDVHYEYQLAGKVGKLEGYTRLIASLVLGNPSQLWLDLRYGTAPDATVRGNLIPCDFVDMRRLRNGIARVTEQLNNQKWKGIPLSPEVFAKAPDIFREVSPDRGERPKLELVHSVPAQSPAQVMVPSAPTVSASAVSAPKKRAKPAQTVPKTPKTSLWELKWRIVELKLARLRLDLEIAMWAESRFSTSGSD